MKVIKKAPFFNHVYNPFEFSSLYNHKTDSTPAVNILEDPESFRIELAAPGYKKGDFKINLENNTLTLSTEKTVSSEEVAEEYRRKEFTYNSFKRSFRLPQTVNQEAITANYEDGILNVRVPKKEEAKKVSKTIDIQ